MNDKYYTNQTIVYKDYVNGRPPINSMGYPNMNITIDELRELIKDAEISFDEPINKNRKRYILIGA
jgi:hypothetical protein